RRQRKKTGQRVNCKTRPPYDRAPFPLSPSRKSRLRNPRHLSPRHRNCSLPGRKLRHRGVFHAETLGANCGARPRACCHPVQLRSAPRPRRPHVPGHESVHHFFFARSLQPVGGVARTKKIRSLSSTIIVFLENGEPPLVSRTQMPPSRKA